MSQHQPQRFRFRHSLAITAVERGRRVYYGTLADLALSMVEPTQGKLRERLVFLSPPALLLSAQIG